MYPLKLKPIYKHRIWGGRKLQQVFKKDIPPDTKIGESWELADLPDDKSIIINGELAGTTLEAAIKKYPGEITGNDNFKGPFPLLIKFIDAHDVLSVQVHPDEQTCRRMGKGDPKTECWYVIESEPGAVIYKGLKPGTNKEQFEKAIEKGTVSELLEKVPVWPGQCHFLPAGTAHSIGAGLLLAEIQTPSDTTYRVFDWKRLDDSGKPRQLHIEEALESIHFCLSGRDLPVTTMGRLLESEYFTIDKGHQAENCELLLLADRMKTLIIITGSGSIKTETKIEVDFNAGDCIIIPAQCNATAAFTKDTQYLTITV